MRLRLALVLVWLSGCLDLELHADLAGPQVVASALPRPRNVEVPVLPVLTFDLSEAVDLASVRVAIVPWDEVGRCDLTPVCAAEASSCERGRCQRDPLSAAAIKGLAEAAPDGAVPLHEPVLEDSPAGPATRLVVTPRRALTPHARHSLLLVLRDRSGAPLVDEDGVAGVWRRDFVTADEGSAGPEARLVAPPSGATGVPPNLVRVATEFARPVVALAGDELTLAAADGGVVRLVDPEPCPGWVPGLCLRWRLAAQVLPDMSYRPGGGTLRDLLGRPAVPPAALTWFQAAADPDLVAPSLADASLRALGPCVYASFTADEPVEARLTVGGAVDVATTVAGPVRLALRLTAAQLGATVAATLRVEDLAGNFAERALEAVPGDSPDLPPLGLAEVLANPRGAEPAQEFVELADLRGDGEPRAWSGLRLTDLPVDALLLALADGETPGDPLPNFSTRPGERVLVVAAAYDPADGADPPPTPGTALLRVDASIAAGGLKNAGEPLVLYVAPEGGPPALVASYGDHIATGAAAHAGRSVVADPSACDLPRAWISHPAGTASPGAAP